MSEKSKKITREGGNQIMTESHEGENIIAVALGQARRNRILEAKQARHACGGGMGRRNDSSYGGRGGGRRRGRGERK